MSVPLGVGGYRWTASVEAGPSLQRLMQYWANTPALVLGHCLGVLAAETVASLRAAVGADLDNPRLTDLVGELSLESEDFRRLGRAMTYAREPPA